MLFAGPLKTHLRRGISQVLNSHTKSKFIHTSRILRSDKASDPTAPTPRNNKDSNPSLHQAESTSPTEKYWANFETNHQNKQNLHSNAIPSPSEHEDEQQDTQMFGEALSMSKKYQKKGIWEDHNARELVHEVQSKLSEADPTLSPGLENQTYTVGDYKLSIENNDDRIAAELEAAKRENIHSHNTIRARKEEEIIADDNEEVISALLDRPSQIDKQIAAKEGKQVLEFSTPEDLQAFEKGGKKQKVTKATEQITRKRTRGPAMKQNEDGALNLTLLYDEQPAQDRVSVKFIDPLKKLKYLAIYPPKVKKWATYMRQCKGRYNKWGYWKQDKLLQIQENEFKDELKTRARQLGDAGLAVMVEKRKRQTLPVDLDGKYRFGVQPEELVGCHPKVAEMLSFRHANKGEINQFRAQQLIKRWQERPDDHGTPQVQIACMTNRIRYLTEHLEKHKKDKVTRFRIRLLISRRQSMLKYLRKHNVPVYFQLVRELDIQDVSF